MIHANAHASLRALLCVIALGACKPDDEPATQIIVSVNSNLEIGDEIARVRIELKEVGGNGNGSTRSFNLSNGSGGTRFPFSFGIQKGSANRVTVIATGFGPIDGGEDGAVIERKENVRFKDGETQLLKLFLNDVCLGNLCEGNSETCQSNAQCGAVRDANLEPIAPGDEDDAWDESASGAGGEGGAGEGGAGEGGAGEGGAGEGGAGEGGAGEGGAGEGGAGEGGAGEGGAGGEAGGPSDCTPACVGEEQCIDQTCVCSVPMTTYYFDSDGDGYGDPTRELESCGVAPDGYVEDSTDCCDADDAVYPMSMEWSFVPSACGLGDDGPSDWDFDCDTVVEAIISIRSGDCCDYVNDWTDGWLDSVAPFCGEPGTISVCNEATCIFEDTDVLQECW
jgi:hypothetical protein